MKQRVITAFALIGICAPLVILGGYFTKALCLIALIIGTYEYVSCICQKDKKSFYLIYVLMLAFTLLNVYFKEYFMYISAFEIIVLFFINVYVEEYDLSKIAFLYLMNHILSLGLDCFAYVRDISLLMTMFILILTYVTDAFALFGGMLFGKHKLNERISPKKTIEGAIVGYITAVIVGLLIAYFYKNSFLIAPTFVLPIVSQLGDLAFSSIKRYFKIKDFGNIFPGHGGMLDRIDSAIFALIAFNMFLGVLM